MLDEITITNFEATVITLASFIGAVIYLVKQFKTWLSKDIKELEKQQTMDFLVTEFARAKRHELTEVEKLRIKDRYDHYIAKPEDGGLGGNSYIKDAYNELVKTKKI